MTENRMAREPKVSVVVPTYNGVQFLRQTIDSVIAQTFREWELIVVDDASTDDTAQLVCSYGDAVRLIRLPANGGVAHARNVGMQAARAEWIALLDHDDWWAPDMLARLMPVTQAHGQAALVYGQCLAVDKEGKPLGKKPWPQRPRSGDHLRDSLWAAGFHLGASLLRKECVATVGWMDENLRGTDDWELMLCLATQFHFVGVEGTLLYFRQHSASLGKKRLHMLQSELLAVERFVLYLNRTGLNNAGLTSLTQCALVRAHCRLAEYYLTENDSECEQHHRAAALAAEPAPGSIPDRAFACRMYGDLGFLYERRGDRNTAQRYYMQAARSWPFNRRIVNRVLRGYLPRALHRRLRRR